MTSVTVNTTEEQGAVLIAQAKDGYKFVNWINSETREVLSTEERLVITPDTARCFRSIFYYRYRRAVIVWSLYF